MKLWSTALLIMALFQSNFAQANEWLFADADCTIIYSLKPAADRQFNQEINKLDRLIQKRKVVFIDLNSWRESSPHKEISGRQRHQIRSLFNLPKNTNQAIVFNQKGHLIGRHSGSVTLVNTLLDCQP